MKFATVIASLLFVGFAAQANSPAGHSETTKTEAEAATHVAKAPMGKKHAKKGMKAPKEVTPSTETNTESTTPTETHDEH